MKGARLIGIALSLASFSPAFAESEAEKALAAAETKFSETWEDIRSTYREDLAKALALGDRIEVYLLDFETVEARAGFLFWDKKLEDGEFPILPDGAKTRILKTAVLTPAQRKEFLPKLQQVVGVAGRVGGGAFCHLPIHGVRIFHGEEILFHSSFCWECGNFAIDYPDAPGWVEITGSELAAAFAKLMPIPQAEIDRFNVKVGRKKKPETDAEGNASAPAEDATRLEKSGD